MEFHKIYRQMAASNLSWTKIGHWHRKCWESNEWWQIRPANNYGDHDKNEQDQVTTVTNISKSKPNWLKSLKHFKWTYKYQKNGDTKWASFQCQNSKRKLSSSWDTQTELNREKLVVKFINSNSISNWQTKKILIAVYYIYSVLLKITNL